MTDDEEALQLELKNLQVGCQVVRGYGVSLGMRRFALDLVAFDPFPAPEANSV